jgi:hypothetical protein
VTLNREEQNFFGADSSKARVEVEFRYSQRFEDHAKKGLFFSYYDFFDPVHAKPLTGLYHHPDGTRSLPPKPIVALTEENFYQYLPTRTASRRDEYGVEPLVESLLVKIPGEGPVRLKKAPKITDYYLDSVRTLRRAKIWDDRIRYTGGWTQWQLLQFIRMNRPTLERVFDKELVQCLIWRNSFAPKTTVQLLVQTCHLIITLRKNPDLRFDPKLMLRLKLRLRKGRPNNCNLSRETLADFWIAGNFKQYETDLLEEINRLTLQLPPTEEASRRDYLVEQFARNRGSRLLKLVLGRKRPDPDQVVSALEESPPWRRVENVLDWTEVAQCLEAGLSPESFEQLMGTDYDRDEPCQQLVKRVLESPSELDGEGEFECPLCGEPLAEKGRALAVTSCPSRHSFHHDCLLEQFTEQAHGHIFGMECPDCQESLIADG